MGVVFEQDLMDLVVIKEIATLDVITVHRRRRSRPGDAEDRLSQYRAIAGRRSRNRHRKLIGIISRRDMVSAYNRALMARSLEADRHD